MAGQTILVVDDNDLYRQTLQDMLSGAGYQVLGANNGRKALEIFGRDAVDLVICDIVMPEKEGIETILDLRRQSKAVRIVAVSGASMDSSITLRAAETLGADAGLEKPVRRAALLELVERLLGAPAG